MVKKISSFLVLLIFPGFLLAQNGYRAGTIVKTNGETEKGFIDYREWRQSPKSIAFKKNVADAEPQLLTPLQIKSFLINNVDEYLAYDGPVSTNKIDFDALPNSVDSTIKHDVAFLRVVLAGANVKLLYHRDETKFAYFIMEKNDKPQELKYYPYIDDERKFTEVSPYLKQLITLLQKYRGNNESWFDSRTKVEYNASTLKKYANLINNNQSVEHKISGDRFYVGAGAIHLNSRFNGPEKFGYEINTPATLTPMLNIGYDVLPNKYTAKMVFRLEASFWRANPTYNFYAGYFAYDALIAALKPQILYNFYNTKDFKIYAGAGFAINKPIQFKNELVATDDGVILTAVSVQTKPGSFTSLKKGDTIQDPYGPLKVFLNIEAKLGMVFNNKFEVVAVGNAFTTPLTDKYNTYLYPFSVGVNYYLGKVK